MTWVFDIRVYEGESDGEGVIHAAHRDSMGEFTACRRDVILPGFYLVPKDKLVTCLECLVRGWSSGAL